MSVCCVSSCKNRYTHGSNVRFFRIPQGSHPFHVNRRRLWEQAIAKANSGNTELLQSRPRVCGAHFISGEASLDFDSPDFVPSVFAHTKEQQDDNMQERRITRSAKRRICTFKTEEITSPSDDSAVDFHSSFLIKTENGVSVKEEETPSELKVPDDTFYCDEKMSTKTKVIPAVTALSPDTSLASLRLPAGVPELIKRRPVVLLKRLFTPEGDFRCESCDQTFGSASLLVKHNQPLGEKRFSMCEICGEGFSCQGDLAKHQVNHPVVLPSFPCNMCDRSFPTIQHLKRHKLLHLRDGRKCLQCGVLFCRRHKHVLFRPQTIATVKSEESSSSDESEEMSSDTTAVKAVVKEAEPSKASALAVANTQRSQIFIPLLTSSFVTIVPGPQDPKLLPEKPHVTTPASYANVLPEGVTPLLLIPSPSPMPPPAPPQPTPPTHSTPPIQAKKLEPHLPAVEQDDLTKFKELDPSLKMFSPHLLTSVLLEVKRDFNYIFNKTNRRKTVKFVNKEESKRVGIVPPASPVKPRLRRRIAYDLEIEL